MNAQRYLISGSSALSVATVLLLWAAPRSTPAAPVTAALAAVCCLAALIPIALRAQRRDTATESGEEPARAPSSESRFPALLAEMRQMLAAAADPVREVADYPIFGRVLSARTMEELGTLLSAARDRLSTAERRSASLSCDVLLDGAILLSLAEAVLGEVSRKTEEATFAVIEKFLVVHEATARAAESARRVRSQIEGDGDSPSVSTAAEGTRETIRNERQAIRELSACTRENHEGISAMSREIEAGISLLESINDIAERSKLIAFNMSVEAARIGEKGAGFRVIIVELHKLNDRTLEFSRKVEELLARFKDHNSRLAENMEVRAAAVVSEVERGMGSAERAVEALIGASTRTEEFAREIASMSEGIDRDMDGVLESMQFQDITRQMTEGAQSILAEAKALIEGGIDSGGAVLGARERHDRLESIRARLVAAAKTQYEKNALMEVRL
jgi:methyl-accepting chemotaxis protein